jgi:hypothetical protein
MPEVKRLDFDLKLKVSAPEIRGVAVGGGSSSGGGSTSNSGGSSLSASTGTTLTGAAAQSAVAGMQGGVNQGQSNQNVNIVAFSRDLRVTQQRGADGNLHEAGCDNDVSCKTFDGSGWIGIVFTDPENLMTQIRAYAGKIDNFVFVTHGYDLMQAIKWGGKAYPSSSFNKKMLDTPLGAFFKNLTNKMADDGNLIFAACNLSRFSTKFANTLTDYLASAQDEGSTKLLNLYFNGDYTTMSFVPRDGKRGNPNVFNIPIGEPLTGVSMNGWLKTGFMGRLILAPERGNNIVLKRGGGISFK